MKNHWLSDRVFFESDVWYKDGYFWRRRTWDKSDGMGDLIFNTMAKILYDQDTSEWAVKAMESCYVLLRARKRWPNRMNDHWSVTTRFKRWIFRPINKITRFIYKHTGWDIRTNLPFRAQRQMSRDPFIAFYAVCIMFNAHLLIKNVTIPFRCWRPDISIWRKYLITGRTEHLTLYRFFDISIFPKKDYVITLNEIIEYAIRIR